MTGTRIKIFDRDYTKPIEQWESDINQFITKVNVQNLISTNHDQVLIWYA